MEIDVEQCSDALFQQSEHEIVTDLRDAIQLLQDFGMTPVDAPARHRTSSKEVRRSFPSIQGILHWPRNEPFIQQSTLSHHISQWLLNNLLASVPADQIQERNRIESLQQVKWRAYNNNSALGAWWSVKSQKKLCQTPRGLMSLTCKHMFEHEDFQTLEALQLGLDIPCILAMNQAQSHSLDLRGHRELCSSTYAGSTWIRSHDYIVHALTLMAHDAGLKQATDQKFRVPVSSNPSHPESKGDIFIPEGLVPNDPSKRCVADVRLGHICDGKGRFIPQKLAKIEKEKTHVHRFYQSRNILSFPLAFTTMLQFGPDACRFIHRMAVLSSVDSQMDGANHTSSPESFQNLDPKSVGITYSRLSSDLLYVVALATIARLRGRPDNLLDSNAHRLDNDEFHDACETFDSEPMEVDGADESSDVFPPVSRRENEDVVPNLVDHPPLASSVGQGLGEGTLLL